jgi:uncharacterized repeat protein (TIGR01451 family)
MSAVVIWAAVTPYTQTFEGLNQADTAALGNDGWIVFANVFSSGGGFLYNYGPFPAPNDGAAFCAIVTGEGGPAQGAQQLSVFSDYNNTGAHGAGDIVETNVFQEQTIEPGDEGATWTFTFDAKMGNLEGASEAEGFIKTLDPANGFATTNHFIADMTSIPNTWGTYSLQITIDAGLVGQLLQIGFTTRASNFEGSGVFYDNVDFRIQAPPSAVTLDKASLFDPPQHDNDGSGTLTPGDTLLYTLVASNTGTADALAVVIDDTPDANTTLTVGSVTTTQGAVTSGNTAGDSSVSVDLGTLAGSTSATITFEVTINDPLPPGVTEISNQGVLTGSGVGTITSNVTTDVIGSGPGGAAIPTLSTWALILFIGLLAAGAVWRLRS